MRHIVLTLSLGVASSFIPAAAADSPLAEREPGLWEIRLVDGSSLASIALGAQRMFKDMPEAQRKQMEQMIGIESATLPTVIQQCLTPEMAQSDLKTLLASHDIQCSELEWQESAGSGRFSFVCANPQGDWTGEGRIWGATAKQFNSEASVQGKYKGQRLAMDMQHEARWMGPDCKGVQPPR